MLTNTYIVGSYFPHTSFIHKLDSRTKLIFIFILITLIFLLESILEYVIILLLLFILFKLARIRVIDVVRSLKWLYWFILFSALFHLFLTKGSNTLATIGNYTIYAEGLSKGTFIGLRLLLLMFSATFLTSITSSIDLTRGLERLIAPLSYLRVPVKEIAFMMGVALRFIPIIAYEADIIIKAQTARGAQFRTGILHKRIYNIVAIIIPLIINVFKRAEDLGVAMDARGFRGANNRTRFTQEFFTYKDVLFLGASLIIFTILYMRSIYG